MNAVYEYGQRRKEEGIKKIAINMIKDGVKDEEVKKYTKLNDKEIKEIRKELELQPDDIAIF